MIKYALRRILLAIPTLFGALVLTFILFNLVGGSPAELDLGKNASTAALAEYDHAHGYHRPYFFAFSAKVPRVGALAASANPDGAACVEFPYPLFPGSYTLRSDSGAERFSVGEGERLAQFSSGAIRVGGKYTLSRNFRNPLDSQFLHQLTDLMRGDLGQSSEYKQPVARVLRDGVMVSLSLTVPILLIGAFISLLAGSLCAAMRGGLFDRAAMAATTALMSVNYVVWVILGQYLLAYKLRLFPLWGYESVACLVLPVAIGVLSSIGPDTRFYRSVMLDEANRPHVRTAISKGLSGSRVVFRHIFRNSMVPVITNLSLSIPFLFTGSVLLESFFGLPGLGGVGLNAVNSSDVAMLRAVVLAGALLYQIANVIADLAYAWFDPRVRIS